MYPSEMEHLSSFPNLFFVFLSCFIVPFALVGTKKTYLVLLSISLVNLLTKVLYFIAKYWK